jgi:hypothetical protein
MRGTAIARPLYRWQFWLPCLKEVLPGWNICRCLNCTALSGPFGLELYRQGVIAGSVIVIEVLMIIFGLADTQPISPGAASEQASDAQAEDAILHRLRI